jgi:hypothetical protein
LEGMNKPERNGGTPERSVRSSGGVVRRIDVVGCVGFVGYFGG